MKNIFKLIFITCLLVTGSKAISQCVVTNTNGGRGDVNSLPWCVNQANYSGGSTDIQFNLPAGGQHVITLDEHIAIEIPLSITGPTDSEVVLDGAAMINPAGYEPGILHMGYSVDVSGTSFSNLTVVNNWYGPGINVFIGPATGGADNVTIDNLNIGVYEDGAFGGNVDHGMTLGHENAGDVSTGWTITNSTISGNDKNGINLQGAQDFEISNNVIGPIPDGTGCISVAAADYPYADAGLGGGNGYDGLYSENSTDLKVFGNIISCNGHATDPTDLTTMIAGTPAGYLGKRGIYFQNTDDSYVYGNNIGSDILGTTALPNYKSGILISTGSTGNVIGGSSTDSANVVSGNGSTSALYSTIADRHGIVIDNGGQGIGGASPSGNNRLSGNYVGVDANGNVLGNVKNGIEIIGEGFNNTIGGPTRAFANVVSGNGENGISIGQGSHDNVIQNNYVGTDVNGTNGLAGSGNGNVGIQLNSGASGDAVAFANLEDNLIYDNVIGFGVIGIQTIGDASIEGVEILRNIIGEDVNGGDMGASGTGVLIQSDLDGIEIGDNTIVNSGIHGISIEPTISTGANNLIYGNNIGVKSDGITVSGNAENGINLVETVSGVIIGGTGTGEENVIVGNNIGVYVDGSGGATDIDVVSNYVGVLNDGVTVAGNTTYGIQIDDVADFTVGDVGGVDGNIVAGNGSGGVLVNGATSASTIEGNTFGVVADQSAGNAITINDGVHTINNNSVVNYAGNGISIADGDNIVTNNTINLTNNGVYVSGGTNDIGTTGNGNEIYSSLTSGVTIDGVIGSTNIDGNNIHDNGSTTAHHGIVLNVSSSSINVGTNEGNTVLDNAGNGIYVGGTDNNIGSATASNTISGNGQYGIQLAGVDNTVLNNIIGLDATGTTDQGNTSHGILVTADGNTIGGIGTGNTISGNDGNGIQLDGIADVTIEGNVIGLDGSDNKIGNAEGIATNAVTGGTINANIISGNTTNGITLFDAQNVDVTNNVIGIGAGGGVAGNGTSGISISDAAANNITGNYIGGNDIRAIGVYGASLDNTISENTIGTDDTGTDLSNIDPTASAIQVAGGSGTQIFDNIVAGSAQAHLIELTDGTNHVVYDNVFGQQNGVGLSSTSSAIYVSSDVQSIRNNVINSPNAAGLHLDGSTVDSVYQNYFGIDDADADLADVINHSGILINNGSSSSFINANVFANMDNDAILVNGDVADIDIDGNFIGVNSSEVKVGLNINGNGIAVDAVAGTSLANLSIHNNVIGNINGQGGIALIDEGTTGLTVDNNFIGVNASGDNISYTSVSAPTAGVYIGGGAADNSISTNTIAYNPEGVYVTDALSVGNTISENSIYCNEVTTLGAGSYTTGTGISLEAGGNTDFLDGVTIVRLDSLIPEVQLDGGAGTSVLKASLGATAGDIVEIFRNDDDCENCQGKSYEASTTIDASGGFEYDFGTALPATDCGSFVITVTDATGNTSTFSDCSACFCVPSPADYDDGLVDYNVDTINLCFGEDTVLSAQPVSGATFIWARLDTADVSVVTQLNGTGVVDQVDQLADETGLYVFVVDNGDCPTISDTVAVVIHEYPDPTITGADAVCENTVGEVYTATGLSDGTSFVWNVADATGNGSDQDTIAVDFTNINATIDITETLTLAGGDGECVGQDTISITVNPLPTPAVNDSTMCTESGVVTLNWGTPTGSDGVYYFDGNVVTAFDSDTASAANSPYVHRFVYTDGTTGCVDSVDFSLVINDLPAVAPVADTLTKICIGSASEFSLAAQFTNPGGGTETFSGTNIDNTVPEFDVLTVGDFQVAYSYEDVNGCVSDTFAIIQVNDTTNPEVIDTSLCSGDPAINMSVLFVDDSPNAVSGDFYNSSNTIVTTFDPSGLGGTSSDFEYRSVTSKGCQGMVEARITVTDPATPSFDPMADICRDAVILITGGNVAGTPESALDSATWRYTDHGNGAVVDSSTGYYFNTKNAVGSSVDLYFVYGTGSCADSAMITVNILDSTVVPFSLSDVCNEATSYTDLSTDPVGFTGGTYSPSSITPSAMSAGEVEILYTYTNADGCQSINKDTIEIFPTPNMDLNSLPNICWNSDSINLMDYLTIPLADGAITFSGSGLQNDSLFNPGLTTQSSVNQSYTLSFDYIDSNTCTNSGSESITVLPVETLTPPDISSSAVCEGQTLTVQLDASDYAAYSSPSVDWSRNGVVDNAFSSITYSNVVDSADVIKALITANVCSDFNGNQTDTVSASIVVEVNAYPTISGSDITICTGTTGELTASSDIAVNWVWPGLGETSETVTVSEEGVYVVSASNVANSSCSDSKDFEVSELTPNVTADISDITVKQGESVVLTASHSGGLVYSYTWSNGSNEFGSSNPQVYETSSDDDSEEMFVVVAEVISSSVSGCTATSEVPLFIVQPIEAPYMFSPNDDGQNDVWIVKNLDGYVNTKVLIYNRWGMQVKKLNSGVNEWDGNNELGTPLPDGVYYYVIEASSGDESVDLTGYVTIIH